MILAYRTLHNPDDEDRVVEIRWFLNRSVFEAYKEKWRGDNWHTVDMQIGIGSTDTIEP
mgnify:CR=1 FL=1